ncbi:MotA/TolQ/ExbB proton channel family protein [Deltaproteobacteria bacterium TL4]
MLDSLLEIYQKGGIMMVPLLGCSLIMVMLVVERALVLRQSYLFPLREMEQLRALVTVETKRLETLKPTLTHPVGRILAYGLSILPASAEHFKEALYDQARREKHYLERGLVILEVIVGVAPLLGLLGTALGMIEVFNKISLEGAERAQGLSQGISQALITTVVGLSIGIPALIAFNLFSRKIESLGLFIEEETMFFYYKIFGEAKT